MTTTSPKPHLRIMRLIFAGAAASAMLALFGAASAATTQPVPGPGSVRLADHASPLSPPNLGGPGGFAADINDDQQAVLQAEQQAEEQNEAAQQQAQQDELQGQQVEAQAGNP
jgi:hypothetical protein